MVGLKRFLVYKDFLRIFKEELFFFIKFLIKLGKKLNKYLVVGS